MVCMSVVLVPKSKVEVSRPLIFLAGPIRSAPNWQDEAISILSSYGEDIAIASPRRGVRDNFAKWVITGQREFERQRAWERNYLDIASKTGSILFWLPGEIEHSCSKSYGAMTRIELGQWMTNSRYNPNINWCIGTDGNFSEIDTIRYDLSVDAPGKKIFGSLEGTCREALRIALKK